MWREALSQPSNCPGRWPRNYQFDSPPVISVDLYILFKLSGGSMSRHHHDRAQSLLCLHVGLQTLACAVGRAAHGTLRGHLNPRFARGSGPRAQHAGSASEMRASLGEPPLTASRSPQSNIKPAPTAPNGRSASPSVLRSRATLQAMPVPA